MKIIINDQRKIHAVQEEFSKVYPFLRLEFFAKGNTSDGSPSKKIVKHSSKTLGECRTIHNDGEMVFSDGVNVAELEQQFRDVFGLSVQVLRKSGNVWLETTKTRNWTLSEQNDEGKSLEHLE